MKESELMKYDWVMFDEQHYEPYTISREYIQVDHFNCGTIYGKSEYSGNTHIAYCEEESLYNSREYSKIMPIPLTPEILEKNGFAQQEGDIIALYIDTPYLYAEYLKNIKRIRMCADKYLCGFNVSINVRYVHELQHALRLCGLNELADNIKI